MADPTENRHLLLDEIANEFAARYRRGERPALTEYIDKHPDLANDIREFFPAMVEIEDVKADAVGPVTVNDNQSPRLEHLGDFHVLREIGRGGMGIVYEAEQLSLGRHVALKLLTQRMLRDSVQKRRFEREAKAAARLHHTNIVPVFGSGEHDGAPYYVMQFIQGLGLDVVAEEVSKLESGTSAIGNRRDVSEVARSLVTGVYQTASDSDNSVQSRARATSDTAGVTVSMTQPVSSGTSGSGRTGKLTYWKGVARIGMQVADALEYAHRQGIIHRDVKPSNLLLDLEGTVWVTDFGLAKSDDQDNLTRTGDMLGTLRYMPPEAFDGKFDARGDVYGLGITLYEMLALRPAFDQHDRNKLIKTVTTSEPPRLRSVRHSIPRDLETIVHKAIDHEPNRRYRTAREMADDLQRFLNDEPIKARRATELEKLGMWCRRRPAIAGLVAALFICLLAGAITSTVFAVRADTFAREAMIRERDATFARDAARKHADEALQQQARAEAGERNATSERKRADQAAEFARQNLYYAQMHLAPQLWRAGHRSLNHLYELLDAWRPQGGALDRRGWEWFYLNSLPFQNLRTLTEGGQESRPSTVAWNVAGNRLAEGTADGLIRIWDVDREVTTLILRSNVPAFAYFGTRWLGWSPDGTRLAAGCNDGTVQIWETSSGRQLHLLRDLHSPVRHVAFSSDGNRLAAWGFDGTIKIWHTDKGEVTASVAHPGIVNAGAWSPDNKLLACGHGDGTLTITGVDSNDKVIKLGGGFAPIVNLSWSPDSTRIAAASCYDYATRVWDVASEKMVAGPLRHSHEVTTVAWEPDGKRLATGSIDETIKIWNATTGQEELTLRGNRHLVTSLSWGPDGRLASACGDGNVKVWNSLRDQEVNPIRAHAGRAHSVAWSPNGKLFASGGDDGKVRIRDAVTRKEVSSINAHNTDRVNGQFGLIRSLAWSQDSLLLASAGLDGTAKVWEVANGKELFTLKSEHGWVWSVAFSGDGNRLAAGCHDGSISVVEGFSAMARPSDRTAIGSEDQNAAHTVARTPTVRTFPAHQGSVRSVAWNPRGDRLASGGGESIVKLWDPNSGVELVRMQGHQHSVVCVAWSPDGKRLASSSYDTLVIAWDAQTGEKLATMRGHHGWVDGIAWNPDGSRIASAGTDDSMRIWDSRTGEETFLLRGSSEMFHDVSWHPDGAQLAAANDDGQVWIWDATRGYERDTTTKAWPFIERRVDSGSMRGEDTLWCAESYIRAGKPREALAIVKNDPNSLSNLVAHLSSKNNSPLDKAARTEFRTVLEHHLTAEPNHSKLIAELIGDLSAADQDWERAIAEYLKAISDEPANVFLLNKLVTAYQAAGRTREAVPHLATFSVAKPSDSMLALKVATLQVWFGQDKEFATTKQRILAAAKDTDDLFTADRISKACSISPSTNKAELEAALDLACRAVDHGAGSGYMAYFHLAYGMAEYRSGHFTESENALTAAMNVGQANLIIANTSAFYRAMSLFRLGKLDDARKLATATAVKMKPLPDDEQNPLSRGVGIDDLILFLAYKEAKALIGFNGEAPRKK